MIRALAVSGWLLLVPALLPTWGTEDYFGKKRVHVFDIGFDLYELRVVESGHPGQDDWTELGRLTYSEPLGVSSLLLLIGVAALVRPRYVPRGSCPPLTST